MATSGTKGGSLSEVLKKQKKKAAEEGLDALVAVAPESVIYTCGFVIPSLRIQGLHRRLAMTVVTQEEAQNALVVVDMETSTAKRQSQWFSDIRTYREFEQEAAEVLVTTLKDFGLSRGRIGIELDYLPAMDFATLCQGLPGAEFVNANKMFLELRSVKTTEEIDRLRRAGRAADKAHKQVQNLAKAGMTEMEVANIISETMFREGIEDISVMIVASGERSVLPNVGPSTRILQAGDIVRIDLLGHIGAYFSDVARTYVVGDPKPEQSAMWTKLSNTLDALKAEIRPGVTTKRIYEVFAKCYEKVGLPASAFVGHGLGLSVHEHPWISKYDRFERPLEEGMVLCVEPFYISGGPDGYQLEDELIVTRDGFELITDQVDTKKLLQIAA